MSNRCQVIYSTTFIGQPRSRVLSALASYVPSLQAGESSGRPPGWGVGAGDGGPGTGDRGRETGPEILVAAAETFAFAASLA